MASCITSYEPVAPGMIWNCEMARYSTRFKKTLPANFFSFSAIRVCLVRSQAKWFSKRIVGPALAALHIAMYVIHIIDETVIPNLIQYAPVLFNSK